MDKNNKTGLSFFILVSSLILGLVFNWFFYGKLLGLAFPLFILLTFLSFFTLATKFELKPNKTVFFLIIPLAFLSLMVFVRSSSLLVFLDSVASIYILLLMIKMTVKDDFGDYKLGNFFWPIIKLPFVFLQKSGKVLAALTTFKDSFGKEKDFSKIAKGILLSIPILFIFLLLFYSADLVFQKYLNNLVNLDLNMETIWQIIIIVFATLLFCGTFRFLQEKPQSENLSEKSPKKYAGFGATEMSILLGSVNILFLIFILVQITYLFGGTGNISEQGFTYAEYVRRGFFELIAVALISFLLVWKIDKETKIEELRSRKLFTLLHLALIIQVLLIIASAYWRLNLYEDAYGFTTLRFYAHAFIIWLGVIFVLLFYKTISHKQESVFALSSFAMAIIFLIVINFVNPDAFIARQNIALFESTKKLDTGYFIFLSEDAIPEVIKALDLPNPEITSSIKRDLSVRQEFLSDLDKPWQSLNLSRLQALDILNSQAEKLKEVNNQPTKNELNLFSE